MGDRNFHKKRRGVTRASITKLSSKVTDLEAMDPNPDNLRAAQSLASKLKTLDAEFKTHHLAIIDATDEEEALGEEQLALDNHDDTISELTVRVQRLISAMMPSPTQDLQQTAARRLKRVQEKLDEIETAVNSVAAEDADSTCTLEQYAERVSDLKSELKDIQSSLYHVELPTGDPILQAQDLIEQAIFRISVLIKKRLRSITHPTVTTGTTPKHGAKLPKLEVPTFDGDILKWKSFWDQYRVSIHDRDDLTPAEKMVYLQGALKDKTAKSTIEGLTRSGEHYADAVKCLQSRYDRPRLIHQTHVRRIIEAPSLKEGAGKELRALHDTVVQHLRALRALGHEPSKEFITSLLELKLDTTTMFEWQRHSHEHTDVPDCKEILEFLDLRARAAEASAPEKKPAKASHSGSSHSGAKTKSIPSFTADTRSTEGSCVACKGEKHPLYSCSKFRSMSHDEMVALLRSNDHCLNCLRPGHYVKECKSLHRCKHCQRPHHSLLHIDNKDSKSTANDTAIANVSGNHASVRLKSNLLLMTCQVLVESPQGKTRARALLDSGSSASFVSERVAQSLLLRRSPQAARICGITGISSDKHMQSLASFTVSSIHSPNRKFSVSAIIVPHVTCDLPVRPVSPEHKWKHLEGLRLADPEFGKPGKIDILLGIDTFIDVVRQGRRKGSCDSPTAIETEFGWVLAGSTGFENPHVVASHHTSILTGDDLLRQFWEVEEKSMPHATLTTEERAVMKQFEGDHSRDTDGRFIVPLPRRPTAKEIGESRAQAVRRFISFERCMHAKGQFCDVDKVIDEYFMNGHAELVPQADLEKPPSHVFYLPVHVVRKESSTTTKLRAVFDASARSSTGTSLNDILMVGPTVHPPLVDVLLRFRSHRVALIADVSRMYRAIRLSESDKDLHRFVWRSNSKAPLLDYRMTRLTFGVSSSSFIANMCVKQNSLDHALEYPEAAKAVSDSFYVDDCLSGSDSIQGAIELQRELQALFERGGFLLRKWNASEPSVLEHIPTELRDAHDILSLSESAEYTKALGIEWNAANDQFHLTIAQSPETKSLTKRALVSDVAKTFDVLGWFSPVLVKAKILLQLLWLEKIGWDDPVPDAILTEWSRWRSELHLLSTCLIPRCYYPRNAAIVAMELHGFSDASERAYSGVVYLRIEDSDGNVYTSIVMSKTRVAPLKRLTIPRLELCGALVMSQILAHCKSVLNISMDKTFAWTDSTIVLNWIQGSPHRFKVFVGNRVAQVMELIPPERWRHVLSTDNPADCASRGIFPSEILTHALWWNGPQWLKLKQDQRPEQLVLKPNLHSDEADELCSFTSCLTSEKQPLIPVDRFSVLDQLVRVTAWMFRFVSNCRSKKVLNREQAWSTLGCGIERSHAVLD